MKWRDFGSESPYGLHCMSWYEPLNHLVSRFLNRLTIGSTVNTNLNLMLPSLDRTSESIIIVTRNHTQRGRRINTYITHSHMYTPTYIHIQVYTYIHTIYIHMLIHTHKHINTNIKTYNTHALIHAHLHPNTWIHSRIHPHTQPCSHIHSRNYIHNTSLTHTTHIKHMHAH